MLETARTGLAGPEAQRMAEEALAEDDDEKLLTSFFLFKSAIEKMSGGSMDLRVSDLTSDSGRDRIRSEEHTSELQSLMRISYAVYCLKTTKQKKNKRAY